MNVEHLSQLAAFMTPVDEKSEINELRELVIDQSRTIAALFQFLESSYEDLRKMQESPVDNGEDRAAVSCVTSFNTAKSILDEIQQSTGYSGTVRNVANVPISHNGAKNG